MNINIKIERITNGFLVTELNDPKKTYYESLTLIINAYVIEEIVGLDKMHKEHDTVGEQYSFNVSLDDSN